MKSFYSTCRKCGKTYHISGCCQCELVDQWLSEAEYHRKKAEECEAIAKRLQEEKDREKEG